MPEDSDAGLVGNPSWFPIDLDVTSRSYRVAHIGLGVLDASFIDTRIDIRGSALAALAAEEVDANVGLVANEGRTGWLFHTSFCCSTLLARALHVPPVQVALKEPLILRRLSDATHAGHNIARLLPSSFRLLARPWTPGGSVIIKPTHVALNIAGYLMAVDSRTRAVLLHSPLRDFLISNLKKPVETQRKIPWLVERAMRASGLDKRLPEEAFSPPDACAAAALQWAAQRELVAGLLQRLPHRMRHLSSDTLLSEGCSAVIAVQSWLGGAASTDNVKAAWASLAARHAKQPSLVYGNAARESEKQLIYEAHKRAIEEAVRWTETWLAPAMSRHALDLPEASRLL